MREASDVQRRALAELAKPASLLLPKPVRDVIVDLLALVVDQERRISNLEQAGLKAGPQPKGSDHGEDQGG